MATAQQIAEALGTKKIGAGWMACCPAHDDRKPSLHIDEGNIPGKVLLYCHGGCSQTRLWERVWEILRSKGIDWKSRKGNGASHSAPVVPKPQPIKPIRAEVIRKSKAEGKGYGLYKEYYFTDRLRKVRFHHKTEKRENGKPGKTFLWEHQRSDGFWYSGQGPGVAPVYFNAVFRDLDQPSYVVLVEGEECADALSKLGIPAASFHNLNEVNAKSLADLDVIIWPDKDTAGSKKLQKAKDLLEEPHG